MDESIQYLQRFIQISEESKDDTALSLACNSLGIRLNCLVRIVTSINEKTMCRHIGWAKKTGTVFYTLIK